MSMALIKEAYNFAADIRVGLYKQFEGDIAVANVVKTVRNADRLNVTVECQVFGTSFEQYRYANSEFKFRAIDIL